jgi:type II secretory pathway pseudopilin PulG
VKGRGLTLVETLVALLVACVTMAAVAHTAFAVQRGERASELLERASLLAGRELEALVARGPLGLVEESSSGPLDDPLGRFERRVRVESGPRENLWHIEVTVIPPHAGAAVSVHTLVRRPWWQP